MGREVIKVIRTSRKAIFFENPSFGLDFTYKTAYTMYRFLNRNVFLLGRRCNDALFFHR